MMRMTMRWHLTRDGAKRQRAKLDSGVKRVATNGSYHVVKRGLFWKVEKRWSA